MIQGRIGHYEIERRIGSGGAGAVYSALDTRLNRRVAIKAIRERYVRDPDARRRLRQEALAAASLDHPYVCKVYELLEIDERPLIVMEYVDGETLRELLADQPLEMAEWLRIGSGLAEALGAAHARGMVHRDIKPSNVMITRHGHVKVMDFGLAKHIGAISDDGTTTLTAPGIMVGTPRFMSPEQARGEPLDQRSDVFSFGVLMYRALTGTYPFEADDAEQYLRKLIAATATPLPEDTPGPIGALLERCLRKNPSERFASGVELTAELRHISDALLTGSSSVLPVHRPRRALKRALPWLAAASALAVALYFQAPRTSLEPLLGTPEAVVTWPSVERDVRISPDGNWFSFISDRSGEDELWLAQRGGADARRIDAQGGRIESHVWSPDGTEIAYVTRRSQSYLLHSIPILGGNPRLAVPLDSGGLDLRLVRWIGSRIYLQVDDQLRYVDSDSGAVEPVTSDWGDLRVFDIDISPDERQLALSALSGGQQHLWISDRDGGALQQLTDGHARDEGPHWWGPDRIAYVSTRGGEGGAWQLDVRSHETQPVLGLPDAAESVWGSADGTLLAAATRSRTADLVMLDPDSRREIVLTADSLQDFRVSIARDAPLMTFQRSRPTSRFGSLQFDASVVVGQWDVPTLGGARTVVAEGFAPRLSANGRWLGYLTALSQSEPTAQLWVRDLSTQSSKMVSASVLVAGFRDFPVALSSDTWAWAGPAPDPGMVFVGLAADGGLVIQRILASDPGGVEILRNAGTWPGDEIGDLRPAPRGGVLAYVHSLVKEHRHTIRLLRPDGQATEIYSGSGRSLSLLGWLADASALVALRIDPAGVSLKGEALLVGLDGRVSVLGALSEVIPGNPRFDPLGGRILWTRGAPTGHNVWQLSLATGSSRALTDNSLPGITYSGILALSGGRLIYSRDERTLDIWSLAF